MESLKARKSQIKIQEMSFMLLALAVFFVIVFLFYISFSTAGLKKNVEELTRQSSISIVARIADAPEFNCEAGMTTCIDTDKLMGFMERKNNYKGYWGENVKGLIIEKIFSYDKVNTANKIECSKENYPLCNYFTIIAPINGTIADSSFVALCRLEYKNGYNYNFCDMGKIIIYTKKGEAI